ncbi:DUF4292 domain-containing protein [Aquiflexum sp.]|uniref:DUF4292 domain-containing protein n=1 Tax=Aquiflexum sp. TaxID=1872584 RepID=UPI0035937E80
MTKASSGILILFVLLLLGCAKKPNLYTSDEIMQEFNPNYFDFKYLSARGRIVLEESNGKITKGTINLRAQKDSVIWFSMTPGLGLEAIRGLITTDKVRIKDRLNGNDINLSFEEMNDRFGLQLSLQLIQNILYANVPEEFSYRDRLIRIGRYFELTQARDGFRFHSRVNTSHGKVSELTSNTLDNSGALLASYPTFENVNNQPFPNKMLLKITFNTDEGIQNAIIHLDLNRIEYQDEPLSFPFQF